MRVGILVCLGVFFLVCAPARAHPLSPATLLLEEKPEAHVFRGQLRYPASARAPLSLEAPSDCKATGITQNVDVHGFLTERFTLRCGASLDGRQIGIRGLFVSGLGALLYLRFQQGRVVRELLAPAHPRFRVPRNSTRFDVVRDYSSLGVWHLFTGIDHVLFVFGLCLLSHRVGRIALALTAFTVGHSLTLSASLLGVARLPSAPTELGIALSLMLLALEVLGPAEGDEVRTPLWMAGAFGLLHGFGFAGALAETGLPGDQIPLSLAAFNLGVELGQLAVVIASAPLLVGYRSLSPPHARRVRGTLGYGLGSLAAMWCLERAAGFW